ncbi:MAG: hypothetical protein EAZ08_06010 [Cytophagales bacterium]|nr:MAG: hypothetical protein EAZ08_06010 [Cytophagales bacterium]
MSILYSFLLFSLVQCNTDKSVYISEDKLIKFTRVSDGDTIITTYYDTENKKIEQVWAIKNGQKNGLYKGYYSNGKLRIEANFINGLVDGSEKQYDSISGNLKTVAYYENGKLYNSIFYRANGSIKSISTWGYHPNKNGEQLISDISFDKLGNIITDQSYYALTNSTDTVLLGKEYICNVKLPFKNTTKEQIRLELECYDKWNRILDKKEIVGKNFEINYKYKPLKNGKYKIRGFVLYPITLPTGGAFFVKIYLEKDFFVK